MKHKVTYFIFCLLIQLKSFAQTPIFKTTFSFSENELSDFLSSISMDEEAIYFIANDFKLHCIDKKTKKLVYTIEIDRKSNDPVFFWKDQVITSLYSDKVHRSVLLDKKTGQVKQKLNLSPLKTQPYFFNDSVFVSTHISEKGGQIFGYDLRNNKLLWEHFVGHGVSWQPYITNNVILANFDFEEWKEISFEGKLADDIYLEKMDQEQLRYEADENYEMVEIAPVENRKFHTLTHDHKELTSDFLQKEYKTTDNLAIKISPKHTVLLSPNKLMILNDNKKIQTNFNLKSIRTSPQEIENDYLAIIYSDTENVWFFYQNHLVKFNFIKNKVSRTYDFTQYNVHQMLLHDENAWLISKKDGEMYEVRIEN